MERLAETTSRAPDHILTGWKGSREYFRFQTHFELRAEAIVEVLRGRVAGVMFRGIVSPEVCATLTERFWANAARRQRSGNAPSFYLGAYHYQKSTSEYLDDCEQFEAPLAEMLDIPANPIKIFREALATALAKDGVTFRLAQHNGRRACQALVRSWHAQGQYALIPHDDQSQCSEPKQAGFEIQRVSQYHPVALNICLENSDSSGGGRLAFWNIKPEEACKSRLGVNHTGAYSAEMVDGIEMLWVDVKPGDMYLFNGAHVHAVESSVNPAGRRTTIAALLGQIDDRTVVSWT